MTPQAAFEQLNRASGIAPLAMPEFDGPQARVPSPFPVATAAAAVLGFAGAAAAEIWRFRGGNKQSVGVDLGAAAASLVAHELVRRNGAPLPAENISPVTGFYHSADLRWMYLHGGLPHLARGALDLLNATDDAAAVRDGVAKWNALALEEALAFLHLCGAAVRSETEWRSSVPGRVLGAPIVLKKIGQAPPSRLKDSATPLGGLRVLDLSRAVAGPAATHFLASQGAEVLNVVNPRLPSLPGLDIGFAAGKRRTELDLKRPADAENLRRLARDADIFVESCRPGALAGLGFSPASLAHLAPGMISVSLSAYGAEGPWAGRRGWEETTQAATGLAAEQGAFMAARRRPHREALPELIPAAVCSTITGTLAAAGVLAAVLKRIREGGIWRVQVSLAATAMWLQSLGRIDAAQVPQAWNPRDGLDQYRQICETGDGRFEFLGPVVRMSETPPLRGSLPDCVEPPSWASAREKANAAEIQPA
jgi:crotonobetainyl-CoA:carnitine CoA-transferase CaiB-like acyl-CoA transferase